MNLAALMTRAANARERGQDDAVDAAGCFIDWQAWWNERMQESPTDGVKQKRVPPSARARSSRNREKNSPARQRMTTRAARSGRVTVG